MQPARAREERAAIRFVHPRTVGQITSKGPAAFRQNRSRGKGKKIENLGGEGEIFFPDKFWREREADFSKGEGLNNVIVVSFADKGKRSWKVWGISKLFKNEWEQKGFPFNKNGCMEAWKSN